MNEAESIILALLSYSKYCIENNDFSNASFFLNGLTKLFDLYNAKTIKTMSIVNYPLFKIFTENSDKILKEFFLEFFLKFDTTSLSKLDRKRLFTFIQFVFFSYDPSPEQRDYSLDYFNEIELLKLNFDILKLHDSLIDLIGHENCNKVFDLLEFARLKNKILLSHAKYILTDEDEYLNENMQARFDSLYLDVDPIYLDMSPKQIVHRALEELELDIRLICYIPPSNEEQDDTLSTLTPEQLRMMIGR